MVWACGKNGCVPCTRRVLMAEERGGRVRGRPRLGWMDGEKVALRNREMMVQASNLWRQRSKDQK